jgi:serine/threonine protein phosphatase 1
MKTYVIGDIHGGLLALQQVLKAVNFDYEKDKLIALGDVTDGWPDVAESIEELLKIKNLVYLKGNHDEWTHRFLKWTLEHGVKMSSNNRIWYTQGGKATVESYEKKNNEHLVDKHLKFLADAKLYYVDEENRIFMHAGFDPDVDLDKQSRIDVGQPMEENASFYWDRTFWRYVVQHDRNGKPITWDAYKEIYIGHTPTINYIEDSKPMNIGNVWNMDSGATYDGRLTIMDIDTKEITQSDPVYKLYPDHMGRNGEYLAKKDETK